MLKVALVLILLLVQASAAFGEENHCKCIRSVTEFSEENPRTKADALKLIKKYDLDWMETCILNISATFEKAGQTATKSAILSLSKD